MTEAEQRLRVAAIAREWIGTPYIHEGRIKHKCADCTFFAEVFEEAGLIPHVKIPHYSPQAHINRGGSLYLAILTQYAKREIKEEEAQIADVVMYNIGRTFSHGGVIVDPGWPQIVHADMLAKQVITGVGDGGRMSGRERRFFSFW